MKSQSNWEKNFGLGPLPMAATNHLGTDLKEKASAQEIKNQVPEEMEVAKTAIK